MLKTVVTLMNAAAIVAVTSGLAQAQSSLPTKPGVELLLQTGRVSATGAQVAERKRTDLTALQLSYGLRPAVVLTSTVGWGRTRPDARVSDTTLDMFTYDVGTEFRLPRRTGDGRFNVKPFTGVGVGARSYNERNADTATAHDVSAYVSAGGEIALAKVRLRLEVRDYLTWADPSGAVGSVRRNDVVFMAGIRLGVR